MASSKLDIIINGIDKSSTALGGVAGALQNMLQVAGGFLAAQVFERIASGIVNVGKTVFDEAMAAQEVQAQLNNVLKATGGVAGVTAGAANDLASSLSGVTRYADDAILGGENLLLTFTNIGKDVFPLATETMLDLSTAMGQDLKSSAIQLGKALNNPVEGMTALSRVGVTFTEEQKKQIEAMQKAGDLAGAQGIILAELQREFGGAAQAAGGTFAGQLDILRNRMLNVAEGIGLALLPVLTDLLDNVIVPIVPLIEQFGMKLAGIVEIFGSLAAGTISFRNAIGLAFGPDGLAILDGAMAVIQPLIDAFNGLFAAVMADAPMIQATMQGMFDFLVNAFSIVGPQLIASLTGSINTLTAIWAAHGDTIMAAVRFAWDVIVATVGGALLLLGGVINAGLIFIQGVMTAFSALLQGDWATLWTNMQTTAAGVWDALSAAFSAFMNLVLSIVGTNLTEFVATWESNLNAAKTIVDTVLRQIVYAIVSQVSEWVAAGNALVDGLKQGIADRVESVLAYLREKLKAVTDLANAIFQVQSPSKVFAEIGQNLMAGLQEGIGAGAPAAGATAAAAASSVVTNFNLGIYTSQSPNVVQSNFATMQALAGI